jgi:putative peptidoglycan lipid II flippase
MEQQAPNIPNNAPVSADANQRTRDLARSTLVVMVAFGVAKVISLGQTVIIAAQVGLGSEWDTFVTANRIPELIFTLIAGGALSHAFIPIFGGYLAKDDRGGAWGLASHVINTIFTATFLASIVAFFIAPWLVQNVVAPGFNADEITQTVEIMRILLVTTLIFSVSGIVMGILQSHNHFLLPALAPIMFDLGILFGVIFLLGPLGVHGIALGAVLGSALHLGIQIPGLIRYKARWKPELGLRDPMLWTVIRLMLPRVAGLGVFSFNFIVMNNIASRLGTGSVSALDWGWRIMQIPQTLLGTAMGTVIFPTLAALSELGDGDGKRDALAGSLRFILVTSIPAAVGLVMVGRPVISLLERGAFDASASALVYSTLQFFALGLIVHSALEIIARGFYADKDTLTPLFAALGGAGINLVLSLTLTEVERVEALALSNITLEQLSGVAQYISAERGNVGMLALANSLGVMFEVGVLLVILRNRWESINEDVLARTVAKTTVASLVMAGAIALTKVVLSTLGLTDGGLIFNVGQVVVETGVGALVFLIVAYLLKLEELQMLVDMVFRRDRLTAQEIAVSGTD